MCGPLTDLIGEIVVQEDGQPTSLIVAFGSWGRCKLSTIELVVRSLEKWAE